MKREKNPAMAVLAMMLLLCAVMLCGCGNKAPEPYVPAQQRIADGEAVVLREDYEQDRCRFSLLSDHTAILTSGHDNTWGGIPWELTVDGETYTVTAIGDEAFINSDTMKLVIPASVREIGARAFVNCDQLNSLTYEGTDPVLTGSQFVGCRSLVRIEVAGKKSPYAVVDGVLMSKDKTRLILYPAGIPQTGYDVPKSVAVIGEYAFASSRNLTAVILPEALQTVERGAFSGCAALEAMTLPGTITRIEDETFAGCARLSSQPFGDEVTWIGQSAFSGCERLSELVLPVRLEHLDDDAFSGCYRLRTVMLPESEAPFAEGIPLALIERKLLIRKDSTCFREADGMITDTSGTRLYRWQGDSALTTIVLPESVTEIAARAFYEREHLVSVTLPAGLMKIGERAFEGCKSLMALQLPEGLETVGAFAFSGCESLERLSLPDSVCEIGPNAFSRCEGLASVKLPAGLTEIGIGWFYQCDSLREFEFPEGLTAIQKEAFCSCDGLTALALPDTLTAIGDEAFMYCDGLVSVTLLEGVTDIGEGAFRQCDALREITFPNGLLTIGREAFFQCPALSGLVFPDSLRTIGGSAFSGCEALASVVFPPDIEEIGACAFEGCNALERVDLSRGVGALGWKAFHGCGALSEALIAGNGETELKNTFWECRGLRSASLSGIAAMSGAFMDCGSLVEVNVPEGVSELGFQNFYHCDRLAAVALPDSVTRLEDEVFCWCGSLTEIEIPKGVTELPDSAFFGCASLTAVSLPEGLKTIGRSAFGDCADLTDITFPESLVSIGDKAFKGTCVHAEVPEHVVLGEDVFPDYGVWVPDQIIRRIKGGEMTLLPEHPGYKGKLIVSVVDHRNTLAKDERETYYRSNCGPNTFAALAETPEEADTLVDIYADLESAGHYFGNGIVGGATRVYTKAYIVDLRTGSYYLWTADVSEPPQRITYSADENTTGFHSGGGEFRPEVVLESIEEALAGNSDPDPK